MSTSLLYVSVLVRRCWRHVLTSKYCDHLPLYRQSEIYARVGMDIDRSTLSDWVGRMPPQT